MASGGSRRKRTQQMELNPEELQTLDSIGHGSTSHVYSALLHGHMVAVKEINSVDDGTLVAVRRELQVLNKTDHPHLLRFIGLISLTPPLRLCLEYCSGGTLFDLLHNMWHVPLSWTQRMKVVVDISGAMEYLHGLRKQIVHRDLKSLNIFLSTPVVDMNSEPDIKIADFGGARIRDKVAPASDKEWPSMTRGVGSQHWMAPEVSLGTHYTCKVDVFSFGIVLYEVLCRHMAFEDKDADVAGHLLSVGKRPTLEWIPQDAPAGMDVLMTRCWSQDPDDRPMFSDITVEVLAIQRYVYDMNDS